MSYLGTIGAAIWVTLGLSCVSLGLAIPVGIAGAAIRLSKRRAPAWFAATYIAIFRGVPDLVLLLIIYYGMPGRLLNPFVAGVITLTLIFGAHLTETFRGAVLAIPRGEIEAGWACGMARGQIFTRIIFPRGTTLALPGVMNHWLVLVKTTALVSLIGLTDVLFAANSAAAATRKPFFFYFVAAIIYLAITAVSIIVAKWFEWSPQ